MFLSVLGEEVNFNVLFLNMVVKNNLLGFSVVLYCVFLIF